MSDLRAAGIVKGDRRAFPTVALACVTTVLVIACSGASKNTPAPTVAPDVQATPSPRPQFPTAPATEDTPIWDFVRNLQGAYISPILHPTFLPPGLITVGIGQSPEKWDPHLMAVEYLGPGKRLVVGAGGFNPPPPGAGGYDKQVTVRGHEASLVFTPEPDPASGVWLHWTEPGTFDGGGGAKIVDFIRVYAVFGRGVTTEEVLQVVDSLTSDP